MEAKAAYGMLSYEPANDKDIGCIFSMNKELIDSYENISAIDYEKVLKWVRQKIETHIGEYTRIIYNGKTAGYYYFHPSDGKMEIDDLYVLPEFRNNGIGSAVLEKCLSESDVPVFLYVFAKNTGAVSLYSRMGFKIIETVRDSRYIMQKNGSAE